MMKRRGEALVQQQQITREEISARHTMVFLAGLLSRLSETRNQGRREGCFCDGSRIAGKGKGGKEKLESELMSALRESRRRSWDFSLSLSCFTLVFFCCSRVVDTAEWEREKKREASSITSLFYSACWEDSPLCRWKLPRLESVRWNI